MADRRLRVVLWVAGAGCGMAAFGVVAPWDWMSSWMAAFGAEEMSASPMRVYGMRAACATWVFVGLFFLLVARNPLAYAPFLNLAIGGLLCVGLVCLITGVAVGMQPPWYLTDVAFCWIIGALLWVWRPSPGAEAAEADPVRE
jgi:hypothetical protein